jgi:putative ABC transport system substrate-binding protein
MRRRQFIAGLGSTAACPVAAWAQQRIAVVGDLGIFGADYGLSNMPAFAQALKDEGFVAGQNVTFDRRYALGEFERLPRLALDLVRQRVD